MDKCSDCASNRANCTSCVGSYIKNTAGDCCLSGNCTDCSSDPDVCTTCDTGYSKSGSDTCCLDPNCQ